LTQVWNGVAFDIDNDGVKESTAWAGEDDGLLALDENNDGVINNQSELFGDTETLTDGFNKLASFDDNNDGRIDQNDYVFEQLVVWQDSNQDGISDKDEMHSLEDLGIESISINAETHDDLYVQDNWISHTSTYTKTDGTSYDVFDAWFQYDDNQSISQNEDFSFANDEAEAAVIEAFNSEEGDILDISEYLTNDENHLQDAINDFVFVNDENDNNFSLQQEAKGISDSDLDVTVIGDIDNNKNVLVTEQSESFI
jgi:hypothetical protein